MATIEGVSLSIVRSGPDGPRTLLEEVSFHIASGGVLAVLGPSGAGKSTLLKTINRLTEPTSGQVLLGGIDTRELHPTELRRRVGMLFQQPALFAGKVVENLNYGPGLRHESLSRNAATELLAGVNLSADFLDRPVERLSGGEQQRVAIARCLANRPEALLLDEPTSALDPASAMGVEELMLNLAKERGLTLIWVTHNVEQAERVADRVLFLAEGHKVAEDDASPFFATRRADLEAMFKNGGEPACQC